MIQADRERLVSEFIELVKIDSETGYEEKISVVLKAKFEALGFKVEEDDAKEKTGHESNNLICTLEGTKEGVEPIFFNSHMDTVVPGKDIQPQIEGDTIRSDGTTILGADDKAGIAAIIEMVRLLKDYDIEHGQIQVVLTIGEESGLIGAKALDASLIDAKYGYAVDSHGDVGGLIVASPTQAKFEITCHGKTAHAGVAPEEGISAITLASKAISKMKLGRIDEDTTANIGRFEGGKATNIVSDEAVVIAEARSLVREKLDRQIEQIKEACRQAEEEVGGSIDVDVKIMYKGYQDGENAQVVKVAGQAAKRIGLEPQLKATGGGSDANVISSYGFPMVNLCVGYQNIHTPEEEISINEMMNISALLTGIVIEAAEEGTA